MSEKLSKGTLNSLQSVASANVSVTSVIEQLASTASTVSDQATRSVLIQAASELLQASKKITGALEQVASEH